MPNAAQSARGGDKTKLAIVAAPTLPRICQVRDARWRSFTAQDERANLREDLASGSTSLDALEDERRRIARDLHDEVEQTFFAIALSVASALDSRHHQPDSAELAEVLRRVSELAQSGAERLRAAIFGLRHAEYSGISLVMTLRDLAQSFELRTGIATDLVLHGPRVDIADEVSELLQAVAHEALVNVERHAHASAVVLKLRTQPRTIWLTVSDDGAGAPRLAIPRLGTSTIHFGLAGLAERVQRMNGTFRAGPGPEIGFVVRARLPRSAGLAP